MDTDTDIKYELNAFPVIDTEDSDAQLLESVYTSIDNILGVPRMQDHDVNPKVHHYTTPIKGNQHKHRFPSGLHVDTNARSRRYATAILYLSSLDDCEDGNTVFPTAKVDITEDKCHEKLQNAAVSLLNENILHTDHAIQDNLVRSAEILLNTSGGLSVQPVIGKLLIFFTRLDNGEVDPYSFHGAARVRPGQEGSIGKWTLQIFKELPKGIAKSSTFIAERRSRLKSLCK